MLKTIRPSSFLLLFMLLFIVACNDAGGDVEVTREVTRVVTEVVTAPASVVEVTRIVEEEVAVTAVAESALSELPAGSKELIICMVHEPDSLYLYSASNFGNAAATALAMRHAVYENLYTTQSYDYQPQGLVKMPSLEDGDAEIFTVTVQGGNIVIDSEGRVVTLVDGIEVITASGEAVIFDGTPLEMQQMQVTFELHPMNWSDGTAVTADDSVFSFEIASDSLTPVGKDRILRTASYSASDDQTILWTGVPGWIDSVYFTNVWEPLPRHQLGTFTAQELLEIPESNRMPLSNGPFVMESWAIGEQVSFIKNENYYRANEGFPKLDRVILKFVPNSDQLVARLLSGQCDVATQDGLDATRVSLLAEAERSNILTPYLQVSNVFEHIDFGINPDDGFAATTPDWFEDVRVRQAMVMCTDRQRMVDELLGGLSEVANAYVPTGHPLYPDDMTTYPYDPAAAMTLLDEALFLDRDVDGIREEPRVRTPMRITLSLSAASEIRQRAVAIFQENMAECGIEVTIESVPAPELFDARGIIFGRRFELVSFPWLSGINPPCELYTTNQIPTDSNNYRGNNNTGWTNGAYDAACETAQAAFWNSDVYQSSHTEALRVFGENMPIIPLFSYVNVAAAQQFVNHFALDPTQPSELWNLFEIDISNTE